MSAIDPEVVARMDAVEWSWATKAPAALSELEFRIKKAGRNKQMLSYSDLARDVEFKISTINDGKPYVIDVRNWTDLDRALIGDFLGYISCRSYKKHGFTASALAVMKNENEPSKHYFDFMRSVKVLDESTDKSILEFWVKQVKMAFKHYGERSFLADKEEREGEER